MVFEVRDACARLRYPNTPVSFNVGRGEVLGFAGLVGAGRSEVARAIFGVDGRNEGAGRARRKRLQISAPQDAITHGIYLVPEDRRQCGLIVDFNVRENISLPGLERYSTAGLINSAKGNGGRQTSLQGNQYQDAFAGNESSQSQRRQPTEGRAGKVA